MSRYRSILVAVTLWLIWPAGLRSQEPASLLTRAVDAYRELDLSTAAGFLRRALAETGADSLATAERVRALSYLGATEFLRDNGDSSEAAFRRLVIVDPRHVLDELIFPPEITSLFARVKRDTKVVQVKIPDVARFRTGEPEYRPQLVASSFHRIVATVDRSDGTSVRQLFEGLIGDSLELEWDGLTSQGTSIAGGRYYLRVESQGAGGRATRVLRVPLEIRVQPVDTVGHPAAPADSLLLPERREGGPGMEALVGGLVAGVGVALLPSLVARDADLSGGRIAVGGTIAIAGVIGFLTQRPGRPIPENIEGNEALWQAWRLEVDRAVQENERRRLRAMLVVQAGVPTAVDLERP